MFACFKLRRFLSSAKMIKRSNHSYEAAIDALNGLQSNAEYLRNKRSNVASRDAEHQATIGIMRNFIKRSGISQDALNRLPVIHVSGTKGKGTTCAYCESILRQHGLKTGFYSSPHLIKVVERVRIAGSSLSMNLFATHFWSIYDNLIKSKVNNFDMPLYFQMVTLVAFKAFIEEKVDVAVVEVGIGGEYDSTNVFSDNSLKINGITSLGLDHMSLLGDTLEQIAWHKAGIMGKGSKTFTVTQKDEAMRVLQERSAEKQSELIVVDEQGDITDFSRNNRTQIINSNLAIKLAKTFLESSNIVINDESIKKAIDETVWPGRFQLYSTDKIDFYIDGAHTEESVAICADWFLENTKNRPYKKALMFNNTGDRNSIEHLKILLKCGFDFVYFVPNTARSFKSPDSINFNVPEAQQLIKCAKHRNIWLQLVQNNETNIDKQQKVLVLPTVADAIADLEKCDKCDLLVTGSLHLVGAVLSIIDPDLQGHVLKTQACLEV